MIALHGVVGIRLAAEMNTKFNLALPPELHDELVRIAERYGKRGGKAQALSAAILAFLEYTEDSQDSFAEEVSAARTRRNYMPMIERARHLGRTRSGGFPTSVAAITTTGKVRSSPENSPKNEQSPRGLVDPARPRGSSRGHSAGREKPHRK